MSVCRSKSVLAEFVGFAVLASALMSAYAGPAIFAASEAVVVDFQGSAADSSHR